MVFPDVPGHAERLLFLSPVWGQKSYSWISCCKVAEAKCQHLRFLRVPFNLQSSEWMTERRVRMRMCWEANIGVLTRAKVSVASFTNLCQNCNRTGVAAALISCGPSRRQSSVLIESENVSKNVLPCLRQFFVWISQPLSHDDAASIREILAQWFRHCRFEDFTCSRTTKVNDKPKMMTTSHLSLIAIGSPDGRECVLFQSFQPSWDFAHILPGDGRKCFKKLRPNRRPCFWSAGPWLISASQSGRWLWGQVTEAQRGSQCSEADENKS